MNTPEITQSADSPPILAGRRVLLTRPRSDSDPLGLLLEQAGATVIRHPVIEIVDPESWHAIDDAIANLQTFGWIVFVSTNGIRQFCKRCDQLNFDVHRVPSRFVAIGPKTADLLKHKGLEVALTPSVSDSSGLADCLLENVGEEQILIFRADRGSNLLAERLSEANKLFQQVTAYRSTDLKTADPHAIDLMKAGRIDWVTITSSAIARSTIRLFGTDLEKTKLVSISPTTTRQLFDLGLFPHAQATRFDMSGVFEAILDWESTNS